TAARPPPRCTIRAARPRGDSTTGISCAQADHGTTPPLAFRLTSQLVSGELIAVAPGEPVQCRSPAGDRRFRATRNEGVVTEPVTHRPGNRCASGGDAVEQRTETGSGGSPSGGLHADIRRALTMSPEHRSTVVDGCVIRWLAWGEPRGPAVLFVHGGAAHSWWWSFTAPLLADRHRVLAIDLSGHGDSGRRERYSFTTWAAEINA